jgi:hypothetical protein
LVERVKIVEVVADVVVEKVVVDDVEEVVVC